MSGSPFSIPKMLPCALLVSALLWGGLMSRDARADVKYTTVAGSNSDGPLAATVQFTAIAGGLKITVTNTLPSTSVMAKGQAVSAFSFTVSGLSKPTAFYQLSGKSVNSADFTAGSTFPGSATVTTFTDTGSGTIDHWKFTTPGSNLVQLETAGNDSPGGNPHYMILPSSAKTGSGSSLSQGHFDPYILGPGTFFLTVPGVTASTVLTTANFTGVKVAFGTGPDKTLGTTGTIENAPEPSTMTIVLGCCGLGFLAIRARKLVSRRT